MICHKRPDYDSKESNCETCSCFVNTFYFPIDCQNLLTSGTKDEVAEACWKLIEDANDERVLLGSTSEIHPAVPVENAMTMYNILRNYKDM